MYFQVMEDVRRLGDTILELRDQKGTLGFPEHAFTYGGWSLNFSIGSRAVSFKARLMEYPS